MTRSPRDAQRWLENLAEESPPERDGLDEAARQQRIALAIDERLERLAVLRARRRRRVFAAAVATAFTAGAAAAYVVLLPLARDDAGVVATLSADRPVEVRHHGAALTSSSARLEATDEVHTALGTTATAILTSGANVALEPDSTVRFEARLESGSSSAQNLLLTRGTVALRVPKLGPHRTLSVVTPDARVTVRGTRFSVSVIGDVDHPETRVRVTEGSVWVDHAGKEDVLSAGQSWSSLPSATTPPSDVGPVTSPGSVLPATSAASSPGAVLPATSAGAVPPGGVAPAGRAPGASAAPSSAAVKDPGAAHAESAASFEPIASAESTLAAENELYWRAVASIRGGDDARALGSLDAFLSRFPASPLAQNADVERLRALLHLGRRDAAVRAAEQYLSKYPRGFARDEAGAIISARAATKSP